MIWLQIKAYAVLDYHDQPIQFFNRNYIRLDDFRRGNRLPIVLGMTYLILILPIPLILAVNSLFCKFENKAIFYKLLNLLTEQDKQYKNIYKITKKKTEDQENEKFHRMEEDRENENEYKMERDQERKYKISKVLPLFFTSITVSSVLLTFHIISIYQFISYQGKIFQIYSARDFTIGISTTYFIFLFLSLIGHIVHTCTSIKVCQAPKNINAIIKVVLILTTISIKINVIYLLSYFMPFVMLAFIYDPLQSSVTYLLGIGCVFGVYLVWWGLTRSCSACKLQQCRETLFKPFCICYFTKNFARSCSYVMFSCTIVFSTAYFFVVLLFILTLGSFSDFETAHNLVVPALIGLAGIFVGKPLFKNIHHKFKLRRHNKITHI